MPFAILGHLGLLAFELLSWRQCWVADPNNVYDFSKFLSLLLNFINQTLAPTLQRDFSFFRKRLSPLSWTPSLNERMETKIQVFLVRFFIHVWCRLLLPFDVIVTKSYLCHYFNTWTMTSIKINVTVRYMNLPVKLGFIFQLNTVLAAPWPSFSLCSRYL